MSRKCFGRGFAPGQRGGRAVKLRPQCRDAGLGRVLANADLRGSLLKLQLAGEELRGVCALLPAMFHFRQRSLNTQRGHELTVRLGDVLLEAVERDLKPIEAVGRIGAAPGERMGELEHLVDVPLRVVVGQNGAREVL